MQGRSVTELMRDYLDLLESKHDFPSELRKQVEAHFQFIQRNKHLLDRHPSALLSLAHAQAEDSRVLQAARDRSAGAELGRPWFKLRNPPPTDPEANILARLEGHREKVNAVAFWQAPNGHPHAISGSNDGTIGVWNLRTGEERFLTAHQGEVHAVALSSDGRHALSGDADGTLIWWDLERGQPLKTLPGHQGGVHAVALSAGGRHALPGSDDRTLIWWDLERGLPLQALTGHQDGMRAVALSADGRHALSGSQDHTLIWWDVIECKRLAVFPTNFPITSVALSAQPPLIAVVGDSRGTVRFLELRVPEKT
jgi:WD40 repeat protein